MLSKCAILLIPPNGAWRAKLPPGRGDIISSETYGTHRANAYKILEETLNLKDVRIYDTIEDAEGKPKRVLNKRETMLAQQKQQVIKDTFARLGLARPAAAECCW